MRTHRNKSFKIPTQDNRRFKGTHSCVFMNASGRTCVIMYKGSHIYLLLTLHCWRTCDATCMPTQSESVGCKIKTSFSFSRPRCFAYTTLSYITVIIAVIMATKSKMHFWGRGVMKEVVAGRLGDSGGSGGRKWLPYGKQAAGNAWHLKLDCRLY